MKAAPLCQRLKEAVAQLEAGQHRPDAHLLVLVLSGALNPVHNGHIGMLHAAGRAVEQQTNGKAVYVGGVLAPSSHAYVKGKLKEDAIQLEMRNAMAEAAVADDPSVVVAPFGVASGNGVCELVVQHLKEHCIAGSASSSTTSTSTNKDEDWRLPKDFSFDRLRVLPVYGSDFYIRYRTVSSKPRVIVTRKDTDGTAEEAKMLYQEQLKPSSPVTVHPDFIFVELEEHVPDYSSTAIREALHTVERGGVSAEKVAQAKDYLSHAFHPEVYRLMKETPPEALFCGRGGRQRRQ